MQTISLDRYSPNAFVLVPEGVFSRDIPNQDQIWSLNLKSNDPHPFYLYTTYGLQAKSIRLFPNFILDNQRISKPEDFSVIPTVTGYSPSSLILKAEYQNRVAFICTYFFPEPEILVGKIQINNLMDKPIEIITQMALNLVPMGNGQPSHPDKSGNNQFLTGNTSKIEPVLFMTGGPKAISNPFPALSIQVGIQEEGSQEIKWALVSKESKTISLQAAKQIIASGWHDDYREHIIHHAGQVIGIKTGDPDWNAAFYLTQVNTNTHLQYYEHQTDEPHFNKIRLPDHPFTSNDQEQGNKELTNLELNHLCQILLPSNVALVSQLLAKQINNQLERLEKASHNNFLKSGYKFKGCPLLASLLLEIYEITQDDKLLARHYRNLSLLFQSWITNTSNGAENGSLHWENPAQLQIDTGLFIFDLWENFSKGLDIKIVESPALYAMLFKEAKALHEISKILGKRSQRKYYSNWQKSILQRLENCWKDETSVYGYKDIETHLTPPPELNYRTYVKQKVVINQTFSEPQRLQCHIFTSDEHTRACTIKILGKSPEGDLLEEVIKSPSILWVLGCAHLTTEHLFGEIISISFEGLKEKDQFLLETADYSQTDITCLLPLWANVGSDSHLKEISSIILDTKDPKLIYGIPETWECQGPLPTNLPIRVNLMWNTLIIEGLIKHGDSTKAAELFTNLMTPIIQGLKDYNGFFPLFETKTGQPVGQINAITGLIPLQLFLKIAGIKLFSPSKIALWGSNPFPWPIEIHWRGLSLRKEENFTNITFPNGATAEHKTDEPVLIALEP